MCRRRTHSGTRAAKSWIQTFNSRSHFCPSSALGRMHLRECTEYYNSFLKLHCIQSRIHQGCQKLDSTYANSTNQSHNYALAPVLWGCSPVATSRRCTEYAKILGESDPTTHMLLPAACCCLGGVISHYFRRPNQTGIMLSSPKFSSLITVLSKGGVC